MKFGLKIEEGRIKSRCGGIGKSIADALNRNNDVYFLKNLKTDIENLETSGQEPIEFYFEDYQHFKIYRDVTTSFLDDVFYEFENSEIEMGSFKTSDFLPILSEYLEIQIKHNREAIQKLDSIYNYLDKFIESKNEIIHSYKKRMRSASFSLNIGRENVGFRYVLKSYKLEFKDNRIWLTKNRQYKEQPPSVFELNNHGAEELLSYLKEDSEIWYNEKMKMIFNENNKMVFIPDED